VVEIKEKIKKGCTIQVIMIMIKCKGRKGREGGRKGDGKRGKREGRIKRDQSEGGINGK
jgi:hypothetical protein